MTLERFVTAQADQLEDIERELRSGRKQTHWMWYVFPQLVGLGHSAMAERYGIAGAAEARAYLEHPLLAPRLRHHTELVIAAPGNLSEIFGVPDDLKFCSSMTLFDHVSPAESFERALARHCAGKRDAATLRLLGVTR